MRLHGIQASAAVAMALAGGCGGTELPQPPASPAARVLNDTSRLTAADELDGLDLARDATGSLHVIWRERSGAAGTGRIFYRRGIGDPLRWTPAVVLADAPAGAPPQIVAGPDGIHVFAGTRLHHWRLSAGGRVDPTGPVLDSTAAPAEAIDAVVVDDGIGLVYRAPAMSGNAALYGLRWTPDGHAGPVRVGRPAPASSPGRATPKLHRAGERLLAVWTTVNSANSYDPATRVTTLRTVETLHSAWSEDGVTWVPGPDAASVPQSEIVAIAPVEAGDAPVVYYAADGLFAMRWTQAQWTPPVLVAGHASQSRPGRSDVTAVAAARCGGSAYVAWVDARYRRTDRRWWNPLGGFPWSDAPDWANNDLFVLSADANAGAAPGPDTRPYRLTPEGSYTGEVAVVPHGRELVVVHTGRARVGKARQASDVPARVLETRIPCG